MTGQPTGLRSCRRAKGAEKQRGRPDCPLHPYRFPIPDCCDGRLLHPAGVRRVIRFPTVILSADTVRIIHTLARWGLMIDAAYLNHGPVGCVSIAKYPVVLSGLPTRDRECPDS
jgi:hypothetical protein